MGFYLQHKIPITQGLEQQITNFKLGFPTRVIPIDREEKPAPIPELTYHAQYINGDPN